MANPPTIKTRFMIISDTHNFQFGDAEKCHGKLTLGLLPKVDVLLHCGDLTQTGGPSAYRGVLKFLSQIDAPLKLVIAGNHDLDLDQKFWDAHMCSDDEEEDIKQHETSLEIMQGEEAKKAGVTYLEEGVGEWKLENGARLRVYSSPYQPEFCGFAFPYERDEDRFNPEEFVKEGVKPVEGSVKMPNWPDVDVVMTHGPPKGILDETYRDGVGCEALLRALGRARPKLCCFGHIHEAYGAAVVRWKHGKELTGENKVDGKEVLLENPFPEAVDGKVEWGKESLMVNAAIMNLGYRPVNAPWVVDIELPRAE